MASIMQRVCPLCEARALMRVPTPRPSPFTQTRFASQMRQQRQSERPKRMSLSGTVGSSKPAPRSDVKSKTKPSRSAGAFGGMNRTFPGERVLLERQRFEEQKERRKKDADRKKVSETRSRSRTRRTKRPEGDMRALKMHHALSVLPYAHRQDVKAQIDSIKSFDEFPLLDGTKQALDETFKGLTDVKPTPIQRLAIPAILGTRDAKGRPLKKTGESTNKQKQFLLAAETGSGKTLAYLVPIIEATKRAESLEKAAEKAAAAVEQQTKKANNAFELESPKVYDPEEDNSGRPRAIVLLPTAELAEQVGAQFKRFSHVIKQRVTVITAQHTATVIRSRLFEQSGIDIVIGTPHLLSSVADSAPRLLSRVTHMVVDEADSLFDRSFAPITSSLLDRANPTLRALVLASATIPRSLDNFLRTRFPEIQRLTTPNLHAIPRRVQLSVVDIDGVPYNGNRDLACADTIWNIGRNAGEDDGGTYGPRRILVFVNEREKATQLANFLQSKGVDAAAMHRDAEDARSGDLLAAFTSADKAVADVENAVTKAQDTRLARPSGTNRTLPNVKVLVATDMASRGIDTVGVRNVVLYDVPHTSIDFIHRLGRTGRMGRRGRGVVLAGKDDRKDVIREVREAMFRGSSLI